MKIFGNNCWKQKCYCNFCTITRMLFVMNLKLYLHGSV